MPLSPPPLDINGEVSPHNHKEILPDDGIIRRISDEQIVFDEKVGTRRISSKAYKASSGPNGGMSVDLQRQIEEAGHDARDYVTTPRWTGSIRFVAGAVRQEGFLIGSDPKHDNPFHGEVWGNFTKSQRKRLRELAEWFVEISGVSI